MPTLYIIDIDETLFVSDAKVRVLDPQGNELRRLEHLEYKQYRPQARERLDYSEFDDADLFYRTSQPVSRMVERVKRIMTEAKDGSFTIFLTARNDMDDRDVFLSVFKKHGIEIERGHIERAGNLQHEPRGYARKAIIIDKYLRRAQFEQAKMFDDDEDNLLAFLGLHATYPEIEMEAYLADTSGEVRLFETRQRRVPRLRGGKRTRI